MTEEITNLSDRQDNNIKKNFFKESINKFKIINNRINNFIQQKKNNNTINKKNSIINKELEEKYEKMSEDITNNISAEGLKELEVFLEKKVNKIKKDNIYNYKEIEIYSRRLGAVKSILGEFEDAQINFDEARKNEKYYDVQKKFSKEELENLLKDPDTTSEDIEKLAELLNEGLGTDEYGEKINFDDNFIEKQRNNIEELEDELRSINSEKFYPPNMQEGIDMEKDYLSLANISFLKSQICTKEEDKKQLLENERYFRKAVFFQKKEKSYNHELNFFSDKKNLENFIYDNVLNVVQLEEKFDYLLKLDKDDRILCKKIYENIEILEKDIKNGSNDKKKEKLAKINLFKLNFLKNMNPPEDEKGENIKKQNECMDKAYEYYEQNAKENSIELNIINLSILNNELEYQLQEQQNKDNSNNKFSFFENLKNRLKKSNEKVVNTSKFKIPKEITNFFIETKEKINNSLKKTKKQLEDIFDPTKSKAKEIYKTLISKGSENPEALYECGRYMRLAGFEEAKVIEYFKIAAEKGSNEAKMELFRHYFKEYKKNKSNNEIKEKLENLLNELPEKYYEIVAEIYTENEEYKKANEYYFKSTLVARRNLDLLKERNLNIKMGDCYAKLADKENNNYQKIENYKRAISYYDKSNNFLKGSILFKTEWKIFKALKNANEIDYYELEMENGEKIKKDNELKEKYRKSIIELELIIGKDFDINKNNFLNEKEYIENILTVLVNEYKDKDYKKYENYLRKLTEISENENYIYDLGYLYKYGSDKYGSNIEEALKYLQKAADLGNTKALFELGEIYINGAEGIEKDENKAQEFFKKVVDSKNADSIRKLGEIYWEKNDKNKAIEYYQKAADLGDASSMRELGQIYASSEKKDINKAIEYYQKAADLGDIDSMIHLGNIYKNGYFGKKNIDKAIEYYQKAADLGDIDSIYNLGNIYLKKDTIKAIEYYQKVADLGNAKALFELGKIYINGAEGIEKDENKAQEFFKKVVDSKDADSIGKLGKIYWEKNDKNKAIEYYQKAANLGDTDSKIKLVEIYKIEKNEEKLIQILESFDNNEKESIANKTVSYVMLGDIYALKDTPDNLKKAKEYYNKAFEQIKSNEKEISEQNKKEINIKHEILNFNEKTTNEDIKNNLKNIFEYVKENYSNFKEKEEKFNEFVKIINLKIAENNKKLVVNNILKANNEFSINEVVIENVR